jgi:hypothetical protein
VTWTIADQVQARNEFEDWWAGQPDIEIDNPVEWYAKDLAAQAWLAACEWTSSLRGDD